MFYRTIPAPSWRTLAIIVWANALLAAVVLAVLLFVAGGAA